MPRYCYVYVLRSSKDAQFYVGLPRDLRARLQSHNDGHTRQNIRHDLPFGVAIPFPALVETDAHRAGFHVAAADDEHPVQVKFMMENSV
jgi:predicted GIY-YIG superfamily endonuclease